MAQGEIKRLRDEAGSLPVEPNADWIVIRPIDANGFKKTKLHLPSQAESQSLHQVYTEMPLQGIVVAVGPGWMLDSGLMRHPGVSVGDHVAVDGSLMISDFLFDGVLYYSLRSSGVKCIYPAWNESHFDKYTLTFSNPTNNGRSN